MSTLCPLCSTNRLPPREFLGRARKGGVRDPIGRPLGKPPTGRGRLLTTDDSFERSPGGPAGASCSPLRRGCCSGRKRPGGCLCRWILPPRRGRCDRRSWRDVRIRLCDSASLRLEDDLSVPQVRGTCWLQSGCQWPELLWTTSGASSLGGSCHTPARPAGSGDAAPVPSAGRHLPDRRTSVLDSIERTFSSSTGSFHPSRLVLAFASCIASHTR
jgi:hypothetical protein